MSEDSAVMNKKKIEGVLFEMALHMRQCPTCVESLLATEDAQANPDCAEYQRLKGVAKKLAGK